MGSLAIGLGLGMCFGGGAVAETPVDILGLSDTYRWSRSDQGVTLNGSTVSQWNDLTGNGHHYVQGTAAAQPLFVASGGPNGTPCLRFDGSNDEMTASTLNLPDPSVTPALVIWVFRQVTWTSGDRLFGDTAGFRVAVYQSATTPRLRQSGTIDGAENVEAAINEWVLMIGFWNDSTSNYLRIQGTVATGTSTADAAGTGRRIGANGATGFSNIELCEEVIGKRNLTAGELTRMQTYITNRYGSGLTA